MSKKPKLSDISGVGPSTAESLKEAGFKSVKKIATADPKELADKVSGVGPATAKKMIAAAKKLLPKESKDSKPKKKKPAKKTKKKKSTKKTKKPKLEDISGVGPSTVDSLKEAGFKSVKKIATADPKELADKVSGVGPATAKKMIAAAQKMVPTEDTPKAKPKPKKEKPKKKPKKEAKPKKKKKKPKKTKKPKKEKKEEPEFITKETLHDRRLLRIAAAKKKRKPAFKHEQAHRWKRVSDSWRKVRGIDSATREKKKGRIAMVSSGYRTPKAVRGLHPSGYIEVRVERPEDIDEKEIDPDIHAIRIGGTVGGKKRQAIIEKADAMLLRVLNPGVSELLDEEDIFSELDGLDDLEVD